jgi:hypothetical protein
LDAIEKTGIYALEDLQTLNGERNFLSKHEYAQLEGKVTHAMRKITERINRLSHVDRYRDFQDYYNQNRKTKNSLSGIRNNSLLFSSYDHSKKVNLLVKEDAYDYMLGLPILSSTTGEYRDFAEYFEEQKEGLRSERIQDILEQIRKNR